MNYRLTTEPINNNYLENLLLSKGVTNLEGFLNPTEDFLQSPEFLDNIKAARDVFDKFIISQENTDKKILILQDCDMDGLTSAAIIYQIIKEIRPDLKVDYILHEHKQHGLSDIVSDPRIVNREYSLIIVPDAGTNDYEYVEQLKEYNTFVLILDHHLKDEDTLVSDNCVIVNNQMSQDYINKDLTGAGVVWQFCRYMYDWYTKQNKSFPNPDKYIDLAALGIISDMGSYLSLENRYIIQKGLSNINNYFFKCACDKQSYSMNGRIDYMNVAFYITPLLNSMIRVGSQPEKERLFLAMVDGHRMVPCNKRGAKGTMEEVAIESLRECTNTKSKQDKITEAAVEQLSVRIFNNNLLDNKFLVVELTDEDDFPQEVNGLVAMRIASKYKRPTFLGRLSPDGNLKGSVRGLNNSELESARSFMLSTSLFEYCSGC